MAPGKFTCATERIVGGGGIMQGRGGRTLDDLQALGFWGSSPKVLPALHQATAVFPDTSVVPEVCGKCCNHRTLEAEVGQLHAGEQPGLHKKTSVPMIFMLMMPPSSLPWRLVL